MPTYRNGNMWTAYNDADAFLVTTNAAINAHGALVMRRGIARQASARFQGLDIAIGKRIAARCGRLGRYGLLIGPCWPLTRVGCFQVKYDWRSHVDIALIHYSTQLLIEVATEYPTANIHLDLIGLGDGELCSQPILQIVAALPDNVTLWVCAAANAIG